MFSTVDGYGGATTATPCEGMEMLGPDERVLRDCITDSNQTFPDAPGELSLNDAVLKDEGREAGTGQLDHHGFSTTSRSKLGPYVCSNPDWYCCTCNHKNLAQDMLPGCKSCGHVYCSAVCTIAR